MWQPDDTLLAETRATLDEQLRSLSQADCPPGPAAREAARGALEAAGTLAFLGLADEAQRALAGAGVPFARAARELVEGLDSEPLDRALGELLELAPELQLASDDELPEIEERIVDALGARDAMELLLAGAGLMPGAAPALGADIESSIVAFDELLARSGGSCRSARGAPPERRGPRPRCGRDCGGGTGARTCPTRRCPISARPRSSSASSPRQGRSSRGWCRPSATSMPS
ncbi:MAG: hypothetical protein HY744_26155 [Deltaproteobacteria bacterium]|nr:hypothetical protein [Deltaproteobacteria bacterium]